MNNNVHYLQQSFNKPDNPFSYYQDFLVTYFPKKLAKHARLLMNCPSVET